MEADFSETTLKLFVFGAGVGLGGVMSLFLTAILGGTFYYDFVLLGIGAMFIGYSVYRAKRHL